MVYRGYRLRQKYSLCWFQRASSKSFQSNGYGRSPVTASSTTMTACEIQLSRVTAEFQLLRARYVKLRLSQVMGAHRMLSTCVEIRNRACGFAGYKCSKSAICTQHYLNILSKLATRPHDKEKGDRRCPAKPTLKPSLTVSHDITTVASDSAGKIGSGSSS